MTARLTYVLCAAIALLSFGTGCGMVGLRPQLAQVDQIAYYTGHVNAATPADGPIVVVLYQSTTPLSVNYYDTVTSAQEAYHLIADPSRKSRILAFVDSNNDGSYTAGERLGVYAGVPKNAHFDRSDETLNNFTIPDMPDSAVGDDLLSTISSGQRRDWMKKQVGNVVALDDDRFAANRVKDGMYRPMDFLKTGHPGLYLLEPYDASRTPVIFVHGIAGSPRDFIDLIARLDRRRFQPWVYYWPTGLRLSAVAVHLDRSLREAELRYALPRYCMVAHSAGGLVSRGAINHRARNGGPMNVGQFISISTPWSGHAGAEMGVRYSPVLVPSWRDMAPDSDYLNSLFATPLPDTTSYALLFGYEGRDALTPGNSDGTVALASVMNPAAQQHAWAIRGYPCNHTSILRNDAAILEVNALMLNSVAPATSAPPSTNAQPAEPAVERRLLASHETIARFDGIAAWRCRGLTAQCPDQCGQSGDMATFSIEEYLAYEKKGRYGEEKAERYQVLVKNTLGKDLVPPSIRQTIDELQPGDRVLLSWNHYYVTKEGASFPERPIARLQKIEPAAAR